MLWLQGAGGLPTPHQAESPSTELQRPRENVSAETKTKRGSGAGCCPKHPTSGGSWVESHRLQQSPAQFEAVSPGLQLGWRMWGAVVLGGWQRRKMQSNQLSDGVIIKITTTPISVELSAFYLHYLIRPHASRGRKVHCPERREGLTPVPKVLGPGPSPQAHRASC